MSTIAPIITTKKKYTIPKQGDIHPQNGLLYLDHQWVAEDYCSRCGNGSHKYYQCNARYHVDGSKLTPRRPDPVCWCTIM
jgi:hypothetical protein